MTINSTAPETAETAGSDRERLILFVCTGNTCRSPMAAAIFNDFESKRAAAKRGSDGGGVRYRAESAGIAAANGAPYSENAVAVMAERGIALVGTARRMTRALAGEADEIVAMTAGHVMRLMLDYPEAATKVRALEPEISDPFGGGVDEYRRCAAELEAAIRAMYFKADATDER